MKLLCVSNYRGTIDHIKGEEGQFRPGEELNVSPDIAAFLQRSSPGSFVAEKPAATAVEEPASDDNPIADAPNRMQKGGRSR